MNLFYCPRPHVRSSALGLAMAGLVSVALACGSHSPGAFAPAGSDDAAAPEGGGYVQQQDDSGQQGSGDSGLNIMNNNTGTGMCKTGFYSGTFTCDYFMGAEAGLNDAPDSGGYGPVTGTMSFQLTQDITMAGELATTDTANGTFAAATGGFIAAAADLTGTLDCAQGAFTGMLVNGTYGLSFFGMPVMDPNNHFGGPLSSMYDGKTATFVGGEWSMAIANPAGACIGTWTASWMGAGDGGITDAGGQ